MGSAGNGKFGNYPNLSSTGTGNSSSKSGTNNEYECPKEIQNISLQDVETSLYYEITNTLPPQGTEVYVNNKIHNGRLVVSNREDTIIGNLPTQYNHLIHCINKGMVYIGFVVSSGESPIPYVVVSIHEG